MRSHPITAALVAALSWIILTTSCVQSPTETPEMDGRGSAAITQPKDEDPTGDDLESELPANVEDSAPKSLGPLGDRLRHGVCVALGKARPKAREAFCRMIPEPDVKGQVLVARTRGET